MLTRIRGQERGAVLVLVMIVMLMILGFAALGVDASAAYSETRQAQSEADAAVIAGALIYLTPATATGEAVAAQVMSFAALNAPGSPPTTTDWENCSDDTKPLDYIPLRDLSLNVISDCISLKQVANAPALLRVRTPNWDMPTAFAGLIGYDTVAISATATAELQYGGGTERVLPFSVPADHQVEECMGTSPSGLLPADTAPCGGPSQGNFGLIESPWFGAGDPHFTSGEKNCSKPGGQPNSDTRSLHHLAYGLDHVITEWPSPPAPPPPGTQSSQNDTGADSCDSADGGILPYIMKTDTGNTQSGPGRAILHKGMLGDDPSITSGSLPGLLRQESSPSGAPRMDFATTGWTRDVDNVGLWTYLIDPPLDSNACHSDQFEDKIGRELTTQMLDCLNNGTPIFGPDLMKSPRFAVVPMLNYNSGVQPGTKWWAVRALRPIFLQSSWYECTNGGNKECLFLPEDFENDPDFDSTNRDHYSILFNPGESTSSPCYLNSGGNCVTPQTNRFQMMGLSALVLDWGQIPDADNQLGGSAPFEVFLHPNE